MESSLENEGIKQDQKLWFGFNIRVFGDLDGNAFVTKCIEKIVEKMSNKEAASFIGRVLLLHGYI